MSTPDDPRPEDAADAASSSPEDATGDAAAELHPGAPGQPDPDGGPVSGVGSADTALDAELMDLGDDELTAALEALLLVVDAPAPASQLADAIGVTAARVEERLVAMAADLTARGSGIDLRTAGDGWRFYTRRDYAPYVERLLQGGARTKLTRAALETLAVVAYRQPVTRARVSAIRGVNVDGVVRTLLARGLLVEAGPDPETGATAYATTELFLERLGITSLQELPAVAPLLPDVDVIDDITESLESDPRFARMDRNASADTPAVTFDSDD